MGVGNLGKMGSISARVGEHFSIASDLCVMDIGGNVWLGS